MKREKNSKYSISIRTEVILVSLMLLLSIALLFPGIFFKGEILSPSGNIFSASPWIGTTPDQLRPKGNPILSDQSDSIIPQIVYFYESIRSGRLPLYTDRIQNGTPFLLAIRHNLLAIPVVVSVFLFGPALGITAYVLALMLLGGLCFYLYLRTLSISTPNSLIATLSFSFNTYAIQSLGFQMHLQYTMLPVALLAIEKIISVRKWYWLLVLAFALNTILLAGYPFVSAFCYSLLVPYTLLRIFNQKTDRIALLGIFMLLGLAALLIAAPSLAGSFDFFSSYEWSHRQRNWAARFSTSNLVTYLVPFFYGSPWEPVYPFNWHKDCLYFGIFPTLAAVTGLIGGLKNPIKLFYVVFAAWVLAVCYNLFGVLESFYQFIPVFNRAFPVHQRHLLALIVPTLAAFGLQEIELNNNKKKLALDVFIVGFIALFAFVQYSNFFSERLPSAYTISHLKLHIPIAIFSAAGLFAVRIAAFRNIIFALLIIIAYLDLNSVSKNYNPTLARENFYPTTKGIKFLKTRLGNHKILPFEHNFLPNTPLAFDIPSIAGRGFFTKKQQELYKLINANAFSNSKAGYIFPFSRETFISSQVLDALAVKYVITPRGKNPAEMPFGSSSKEADIILRQKDWNASTMLKAGDVISQTFQLSDSATVTTLTVYLAKNMLPNKTWLEAKISGENSSDTFSRLIDPGRSSPVSFSLKGLELHADRPYQISLSMPQIKSGSISLYIAENVDRLPSGSLIVNGQLRSADLKLSLLSPNRAALTDLEFQEKNHLNDFRVVYDQEMTIWENTDVFDRAWLVSKIFIAQGETALEKLRSQQIDLSTTAIVLPEDERYLKNINGEKENASEDILEIEELSETTQIFRSNISNSKLLVISDNFDPGWQATVNEKSVKIFRVNHNMRGILLPPGKSMITLKYHPYFLTPSLLLVLLSALPLGLSLKIARGRI